MDSTTNGGASSSSSSSYTHSWTYHVFLSFRGEDTRHNFVDHLYNNLVQNRIKTFKDEETLKRGEEISSSLLKAIEQSRISLVVFSENYASSHWCLDELVHILDCKEKLQHKVFPVFYKVNPSDVRNQTGSFGKALSDHESKLIDNMDKVRRWRQTLTKAAGLSGFQANGHEHKFIQDIIEDIKKVLDDTHVDVAKYPVGTESRVEQSGSVFVDPPVQRRQGQTEDQKRHEHHFPSSLSPSRRSSDAAPPATTANSDQDRDRDRERDRDQDRDRDRDRDRDPSLSMAQYWSRLETQIRRMWVQNKKKILIVLGLLTALFLIIFVVLPLILVQVIFQRNAGKALSWIPGTPPQQAPNVV